MLAIPVHCKGGIHWTVVVVFFEEKKIQYYDSLNGDGHIYVDAVLSYLDDIHEEECKKKTETDGKVDNDKKEGDKKEEETSPDKKKKESALRKLGWVTCPRSPEGTPEQPNDWDCGVYIYCFVEQLWLKSKPPVTKEECFNKRMRLAWAILQYSLMPKSKWGESFSGIDSF